MWYDSVVERIPSVPSINAVLQMRQITAVIAPSITEFTMTIKIN